MSHYLDIHLRQDPEFAPHQLLAALYAKLHRALVRMENSRVGVCFPGFQESPPSLGDALRLLGSPSDLDRLMTLDWLQGMHDHVDVRSFLAVPANATYRHLRRVQAKSNPERLRRRQMRRHGLTEKEALDRVPEHVAERLGLPFVQVRSGSTAQVFRLYLRLGPPVSEPVPGSFNAYGLSGTATIPWF